MDDRITKDYYRIYDEHYEFICMFILKRVSNQWVADDLTQETFVRAFRNLNTLKDESKIKAWLIQIARNLCSDYFRSRQGHGSDIRELELGDEPFSDHSIEKIIQKKQMSRCVQKQMKNLPEAQRNALWLFEVIGLSTVEIAELMGVSVENVKVRLHRARHNLKAILKEKCCFENDERGVLVCEPRTE